MKNPANPALILDSYHRALRARAGSAEGEVS